VSNQGYIMPDLACIACGYAAGQHSNGCIYNDNFYSFTSEGGIQMATTSNNNVIEVVLITEDEEGDQSVAFGPKAYAAHNAQAAIVKATSEFIETGGDASQVVNVLTRFFG
jgi:hypothetical protein